MPYFVDDTSIPGRLAGSYSAPSRDRDRPEERVPTRYTHCFENYDLAFQFVETSKGKRSFRTGRRVVHSNGPIIKPSCADVPEIRADEPDKFFICDQRVPQHQRGTYLSGGVIGEFTDYSTKIGDVQDHILEQGSEHFSDGTIVRSNGPILSGPTVRSGRLDGLPKPGYADFGQMPPPTYQPSLPDGYWEQPSGPAVPG
jgi:hypothetical protein